MLFHGEATGSWQQVQPQKKTAQHCRQRLSDKPKSPCRCTSPRGSCTASGAHWPINLRSAANQRSTSAVHISSLGARSHNCARLCGTPVLLPFKLVHSSTAFQPLSDQTHAPTVRPLKPKRSCTAEERRSNHELSRARFRPVGQAAVQTFGYCTNRHFAAHLAVQTR